jgi:hypothetical protein
MAVVILLIAISPQVLLAQQPLKSVTHDATLTGNGTSTSPLGVASSALPSGALKVVDANGQVAGVVGFLVSDPLNGAGTAIVVRFVADAALPLSFQVGLNGFTDRTPTLSFESGDCTGTGYLGVHPNNLTFVEAGAQGNVHYFYPITGGTIRTIRSVGPGPGVECFANPNLSQDLLVDVPVTVDFSLFGLVPPFRLTQ